MIDWHVEGESFGTCNCADGCPCQFEAMQIPAWCMPGLSADRVRGAAIGVPWRVVVHRARPGYGQDGIADDTGPVRYGNENGQRRRCLKGSGRWGTHC